MDIFHNATDVSLVVPLVDVDGNPLNVTAVQYRVSDSQGVELVAMGALAGFASGAATATFVVPANKNTLATGALTDVRVIDVLCTTGGNTVHLRASYAIQTADPLQVGVNSFVTLAGADFVSIHVPNTPGWDKARVSERVAALIDARTRICQLNFTGMGDNGFWGQENLTATGAFGWGGNLSYLTEQQYLALPIRFRTAIELAQVAEADSILGGDPVEAKRRAGLMVDTIGETKQMYRPGKPLELPVSRRALSYLSLFVSFSKRLAR